MALGYNIQFAGVPFVPDMAKVVRLPTLKGPGFVPEGQEPPRKHQPLADLVDELNRLIPFDRLQDQASPSPYLGHNLTAIASQEPGRRQPVPEVKIGEWWYPNTATRWSVFRGLATSSMAKAMLAATKGAPATFTMEVVPSAPHQKPSSSYLLQSPMYMLPPRPLGEHGGKFDGLYLITLVDLRYYWQYASTDLRVNSTTTWDQLIAQLGNDLGVVFTADPTPMEYGQPAPDSQLWGNLENTAVLLDAVAYATGRVVVRQLADVYQLQTPLAGRTVATSNRGQANRVARVAGGNIFEGGGTKLPAGDLSNAKNAVLPSSVVVGFPKYVAGNDPVPHFVNPRYQNQRPSAWYEEGYGDLYQIVVPLVSGDGPLTSGATANTTTLPISGSLLSGLVGVATVAHSMKSTAKALYSSEFRAASGVMAPTNNSGLTALAMSLVRDYYYGQVAAALDEVYPGTLAWQPESIHDIIWTWSAKDRLASTRVMRTEWNQRIDEFQHATPPDNFYTQTNTPKGVGGKSVAQSWRDSFNGGISTTVLGSGLVPPAVASGDSYVLFNDISYFPTQNRWRGLLDTETILFEGTSGGVLLGNSGGYIVNVAYRGIDGTLQVPHQSGAPVQWVVPDVQYGVNLVTQEKMHWAFPHEWTSGGIMGIREVPVLQTVYLYENTGLVVSGITYYSGSVNIYDTTKPAGSNFIRQELVWAVERNNLAPNSGFYYGAQFAGFSRVPAAPVYLIGAGEGCDCAGGGGGGGNVPPNCCGCPAYEFTLSSMSAGCGGNGNWELKFTGGSSNCQWCGSGPDGGMACLTLKPGNSGSLAVLEICTNDGCCGAYHGTVSAGCDFFFLSLDDTGTGAGVSGSTNSFGFPDTLQVNCTQIGSNSGASGSGSVASGGCVPGICNLCDNPPSTWTITVAGASTAALNGTWVLNSLDNCRWTATKVVAGITYYASYMIGVGVQTLGFLNLTNGTTLAVYSAPGISNRNCCPTSVQLTAMSGIGNSNTPCSICTGLGSGNTPTAWTATWDPTAWTGCYASIGAIGVGITLGQTGNPCRWTWNVVGAGVAGILTIGAGGVMTGQFFSASGASEVDGTATVTDCCVNGAITMNLTTGVSCAAGDGGPAGTFPATITLTPSCSQGGIMPTTLTAVPTCCNSGGGGGSTSGASGGSTSGGGSSGSSGAGACCGYSALNCPNLVLKMTDAGGCACFDNISFNLVGDCSSTPLTWTGSTSSGCVGGVGATLSCDTLGNWSLIMPGTRCAFTGSHSPATVPCGTGSGAVILTFTGLLQTNGGGCTGCETGKINVTISLP